MLEGLEREAREAKKGCGLIRNRCRRGSGERGTGDRSIADESAAAGEENHLLVVLPA